MTQNVIADSLLRRSDPAQHGDHLADNDRIVPKNRRVDRVVRHQPDVSAGVLGSATDQLAGWSHLLVAALVRYVAGPGRHVDQVFDLVAHDLGSADRPPQDSFIQRDPQQRRTVALQDRLTLYAGRYLLVNVRCLDLVVGTLRTAPGVDLLGAPRWRLALLVSWAEPVVDSDDAAAAATQIVRVLRSRDE
jgi:hypothetical protein